MNHHLPLSRSHTGWVLPLWAWLWRAALWLVVVAGMALFMVWGAILLLIVPRVADLRPWVEQQVQQNWGVQLRMGEVSAYAQAWIPTLEVRDLVVTDAQQQEVLRIDRLVARLSPRSLGSLSFQQVYAQGVVLDVRRDAQAEWHVAGQRLGHSDQQAAANWFFSQAEFALQQGRVRFTDERLRAAPVWIDDIQSRVLNHVNRHELRIDATPPPSWGDRVSWRAQMSQPLLSLHNGRWSEWSGQMYLLAPRMDAAMAQALANNVDAEWQWQSGAGRMQVWAEVAAGSAISLTADLDLPAAQIKLGPELPLLQVTGVQGRVGYQQDAQGQQVFSDNLRLQTREGDNWPVGALRLGWRGPAGQASDVRFQADALELATVHRIAQRLPLPLAWREALAQHQPAGRLQQFDMRWQNAPDGLRYAFKGKLTKAALKPSAADAKQAYPGFQGWDVDFDLDQQKGELRLHTEGGAVDGLTALADPRWVFDKASAQLSWQRQGEAWSVKLKELQLSNADGAGELQGSWSTTPKAQGLDRFPGVVDLKGQFSRLEARQVHRYLPVLLPANVRDYLRVSLPKGQAQKVSLKLKGELRQFPFRQPNQGEFVLRGQVNDLTFAYVPPTANVADANPATDWPALVGVSGELIFQGPGLQLKNAKARLQGAPNVAWQNIQVSMADLALAPQVEVQGDARGPLADMVGVVRRSAVHGLTGQVLEQVQASGLADLRLGLTIPLQSLDKTKVQGRLTLANNEVQWSSATPMLTRAKGVLQFTESSAVATGVQARMWDGDTRLDVRYNAKATGTEAPLSVQAVGAISGDGLAQARELPTLARLAPFVKGRSNFTFNLGLRQGQPEWQIASNLQGMELSLPAPLNKKADAVWPLRLEQLVGREPRRDNLQLSVGSVLALRYERDNSAATPRVLRGAVLLGDAVAAGLTMPDQGVLFKMAMPAIDADGWQTLLTQDSKSSVGGADATQAYWPTAYAVQSKLVSWEQRELHNLQLSGTRQGNAWRNQVVADELEGLLEYQPAAPQAPARLFARLARLNIPPSAVADLEITLFEQPKSLPALDIVINDLQLRGKKLGRAEIAAVNLPAGPRAIGEWRLNRLNLTVPEAQLSASGQWVAGTSPQQRRRTQLKFTLDVADAGDFLARMGTPGAVRAGKGRMEGQVAWLGSPLTIDYPSMSGQFNLNIERGQFLKSDPGAARLLGVLSLQSLPRRLTLDFRDVFSEGFAFDVFQGDVQIEQGVAITNNLKMKGVAAAVLMEGRADIQHETQDIKVVVVPEINAGTASLVYGVINPLAGLTSFLTQLVLRQPLIDANTRTFRVDGTWSDPRVTPIKADAAAPVVPAPEPPPASNRKGINP